jgi:hypothetical protein
MNTTKLGLLVLAVVCAAGCKATKEQELERVAKDWCLTIRASQVLPVYPLTQDLQPGDVFLVQLPIDAQQRLWRDKGYLPLDNHVARIDPTGYSTFYASSFPNDEKKPLPLARLSETPAWSGAPHAAFPSYSFSVENGAGFNLAVPIQAVPVGLGFLGASAAQGSVSIGEARTLGVDLVSLDSQLRTWAADAGSEFLAPYASTASRKNYLRVVSRVYLTGKLDVSLRDSTQRSGGVDVGAPSAAALLTPQVAKTPAETPEAAAQSYTDAIAKLNEMLASQDRFEVGANGAKTLKPGGSLRLTSASARAVSLSETFDPPLVIGYLGFDCEIGPGGHLGPAVPTHALLAGELGGEAFLERDPIAKAYLDQLWLSTYQVARSRSADDAGARAAVERCDELAKTIPPEPTEWTLGPAGLAETPLALASEATPYEHFRAWLGTRAKSARALRDALAHDPCTFTRAGGTPQTAARGSTEHAELEKLASALEAEAAKPASEAQHDQARRALADWLFTNLYATPTE